MNDVKKICVGNFNVADELKLFGRISNVLLRKILCAKRVGL